MRNLAIALLALLALLSGGCSVIFLFASLLDHRPMESLSFVGVPALIGLGICAVCALVIRAIVKSPQGSAAPPPPPNDRSKDRW